MTCGYSDERYAASLAAFGTPRRLPQSGAWILDRPIPGSDARDAMGCYPLFAARDWSRLPSDLSAIETSLTSLVVVTDPFGAYDERLLKECFPDRIVPFKNHLVVDLAQEGRAWVSRHHLRNARKAHAQIQVDAPDPPTVLDEWSELYRSLVERHSIRGIAKFSREAFAMQLRIPGVVVLRALEGPVTVGMLLWYVRDDIGYYHLGAYTARGYELGASFALFDQAIDHFRSLGIRWLDLGAEAGTSGSAAGLARFKQGWANSVRTAYLCGRVFHRKRYDEAVAATGTQSLADRYFPAYRAGEFG